MADESATIHGTGESSIVRAFNTVLALMLC